MWSMLTGEPPQLGQGSEGRPRAARQQGAVAQGHGPGGAGGPACSKASSGRQSTAGWRGVGPASCARMRRLPWFGALCVLCCVVNRRALLLDMLTWPTPAFSLA